MLVGLPIGFASSLCGIGGGLFAGPLLHFAHGFELRRSTGTALVLVLATTASATAVELGRSRTALEPGLLVAVVSGVWLGAKLGFFLSERLSDRLVRTVFAVVLVLAAVRTFLSPGGSAAAGEVEQAAAWTGLVPAALVGLAGGVATPLLGVGGGLVMVPGLFLLVPGLGFDTARATSLAAGVVGSLRSLRLKARAGRVSWSHGLLLAGGSLVGAAAGVAALDALASLVEAGRLLLAGILLVAGLRFGRESLRRDQL